MKYLLVIGMLLIAGVAGADSYNPDIHSDWYNRQHEDQEKTQDELSQAGRDYRAEQELVNNEKIARDMDTIARNSEKEDN